MTIHTKYFGPTDHRGARIKAYTSHGRSCTIPYPYELTGAAAHIKAVKALLEQQGWTDLLETFSASIPVDGSGYVDCVRYGESSDKRGYTFVFSKIRNDADVARDYA